jgi:small subunit ribosomal protein S20
VKSHVRAVEEALAKGDRGAAERALQAAEPELMRAANRNVIHRNRASRKISRLARRVKAVQA